MLKKMEMNSKKSKKNNANALEGLARRTDTGLGKAVDRGYMDVNNNLRDKKHRKHKKRESELVEDEIDCANAAAHEMGSSQLCEEHQIKRKKKKKKKHSLSFSDKPQHAKNSSALEAPKEILPKKNLDFAKAENTSNDIKKGEKCAKQMKKRGQNYYQDRDCKEQKKVVDVKAIGDSEEKVAKKKRKREKKKENDDRTAKCQESTTEELMTEDSTLNNKDITNDESNSLSKDGEAREHSNGKKKKKKKKKTKSVEDSSKDPKPKGKSKRVSFSGQVEVFPISSTNTWIEKNQDDLVRGKRFSKEEDDIVKEAVVKYIDQHSLGDKGLVMVMNCRSYPKVKDCWKEIGAALLHRPNSAVYYRAHTLFQRSDNRAWTEEEFSFVRESQQKHGNKWKMVAEELGKHRVHVKDAWRRIKSNNLKKGNWSQEEYQTLYDLVNLDLQMKVEEEKKSKHGMLRDNIPWTAISDKLTTRSNAICCMKWYRQLTSSLVTEGKWSDSDDYRLLGALYNLDAACEEDVDWDNLLEHRSGEVCQKRWDQMVLHIGHYMSKPFAEQVEILAKRYCPELAEAREIWDGKPVVP